MSQKANPHLFRYGWSSFWKTNFYFVNTFKSNLLNYNIINEICNFFFSKLGFKIIFLKNSIFNKNLYIYIFFYRYQYLRKLKLKVRKFNIHFNFNYFLNVKS